MTNKEFEEWSKYIYGLLCCDYYENLSSGAECYLEKAKLNKNTAEHDFLQDLAELDVSICELYWSKQPLQDIAKHWLELDNKFREYDPINSTLMCVIYHKMYPNCEYTPNKYHPVKFYATFGIIPDLETFEKIKGEDVGGWINAWENPQKVLEKYNSYIVGIVHPSREETMKALHEQEIATQMTIFDLLKGGE